MSKPALIIRLAGAMWAYIISRNVTDMWSLMAYVELAIAPCSFSAEWLEIMGSSADNLCLTEDHK